MGKSCGCWRLPPRGARDAARGAAVALAPTPQPRVRAAAQEKGRISRRLLLETQELALLESSGQVNPLFKTREVRAHTKSTYQQSK
jgi:hypothetical protein